MTAKSNDRVVLADVRNVLVPQSAIPGYALDDAEEREAVFPSAQIKPLPAQWREEPDTQLALVEVRDFWIEQRFDREWIAAYRIVPNFEGSPVIAEVRLFPFEQARRHPGEWSAQLLGVRARAPEGGITKRLMNRIPVHPALLLGMREIRVTGDAKTPTRLQRARLREQLAREFGIESEEPPEPADRGRPRDDLALARLAHRCAEESLTHRNYLQRAADKAGLKYSTALGMLFKARERGIVARAGGRGRGGVELTELGRTLLAQARRQKKQRSKA